MMKQDIETWADLDRLLEEFYKVAMKDEEIGHHFDDLDLETHLPVIGDFWEKVLFGRPVYFNNPLAAHLKLDQKFPLMPEHFIRWVAIFTQIVDQLFDGEMADAAKGRARMIAGNMSNRVNGMRLAYG
ncbi:MAG: group III truncated hemoglobin [Pyrinomonadaceae bacterium]